MQRFRFSEMADVMLLREVVSVNVFEYKNGLGWKIVAANLAKTDISHRPISARTVRDRTNLLLEQYVGQRETNEGSSADSEEHMGEKETLLKEALQQREDSLKRNLDETKPLKDMELLDLIRQQATQRLLSAENECEEESCCNSNISTSDEVTSPTERRGKKRSAETDLLDFLKEWEKNRARERLEELRLRHEEMEFQKDERTALMALLAKFIPRGQFHQ